MATEATSDAFERVLMQSGASLRRDAVDVRVVAEVKSGIGRIINSQSEVGGWPELHSLPYPTDTDGDGMPDDWERGHGLDPQDPRDGNFSMDSDGYTNLEVYLNCLALKDCSGK